ncbi:hypothetical protein B0T16DRAFT_384262 [Cercophora newfieldiana]|uniref:Uncharacterized protein n=1 Tax=Cercophora newfieldiana TaxID=92897 RepID=A0AA39YMP0_9PEZI|nr:hypothetical protein B0T16DRAFT_384262 [Cercophora newfieldiana]
MPFTPEIETILRSNPSDNLLVAPSIWTCRHLELLNIEFQELEIREDSGNNEDHAKGKVKNGRRGKGAGSRRNWRYRERHRYSVCALLDGYPDDENITVYKACISRTFLSKFGFPDTLLEYAQTPSATPESLIIRHMLIPCKPRSTLEDRLLDAIGTVNSWDPYHLPGSLAEEFGLTAHPASG